MNAIESDLEMQEFARGDQWGTACAAGFHPAFYAELLKLPEWERQAAEAEALPVAMAAVEDQARADAVECSPLPLAFFDGAKAGFKAEWNRLQAADGGD